MLIMILGHNAQQYRLRPEQMPVQYYINLICVTCSEGHAFVNS